MRASTNLRGVAASSNIVAGILVGGHSTRMGTPKALLPHPAGGTLLEYLVRVSARVAGTVVILGSLDDLPNSLNTVRRLDDRFPDHGPLAGLEALLSFAGSRWCLLIGCDLPWLDEELLLGIASQFEGGWDAVAFAAGEVGPSHHACCAGYHGRVLGIVRKKLHLGQLRMQSLLADVRTRTLTPSALQRERLLNANTPEDLRTVWSKCRSEADFDKARALSKRVSSESEVCRRRSIDHDSAICQASVSRLEG